MNRISQEPLELDYLPFTFSHNPIEACEQNISRTACARVMIFESHIVFKV